MKIEMKRDDFIMAKNILIEVQSEWKKKTADMIADKNCSAEIYNEHLDSCEKLAIILRELKEKL